MKTYEIKSELYALQDLLEEAETNPKHDPETGEVLPVDTALIELAEEIEAELEEKADSIAYLIKEAKDSEAAVAAEIKRLQERKKAFMNQQEKLKDLLCYLLGGQKLKTERFTFYYQKTKRLMIDDEAEVPSDYISFTPRVNKTDLKKAVEAEPEKYAGVAHIEEEIGLRIK